MKYETNWIPSSPHLLNLKIVMESQSLIFPGTMELQNFGRLFGKPERVLHAGPQASI